MIVEAVCNMFFGLVEFLVAMFSAPLNIPAWIGDASVVIGYGLMIFPLDIWAFCIGSFALWTGIHFAWAIIEWIYKKIPGVN